LTIRWCNVGINLTRDIPHLVTGEVSAKDAKGVTQGSPGYLGIAIYPGDRLISIDGWNMENEPIGIIKTALRGPVHSLAKMKFVRTVLRGESMNDDFTTHAHSVHRTKDYLDFSFEVDVLRELGSDNGRQTLTTSQSLYGLLAVRDKANSLLGIEAGRDKDSNVIPAWAVNPKITSKSMSAWITNDITATRTNDSSANSASPMNPTRTLYSSPSPAMDISFSPITSKVAQRESTRDACTTQNTSYSTATYSVGENPLPQFIADMMDPDSPRACDSADPWVFVL